MMDIQTIPQEQIEKKRTAWGTFGVTMHEAEMRLQAREQAIANGLKVPSTIEEVPEAEDALKSIKKELASVVDARKEITSKLDAVQSRLMAPEKKISEHISTLQDGIIKLKKQHESAQAEAAALEKAKQDNRISVLRHFSNEESRIKQGITDYINKAYAYALDNISPENLQPYIDQVTAGADKRKLYDVSSFDGEPIPDNLSQMVLSAYFGGLILNKFSDFAEAVKHKATALERSRKEAEDAAEKARLEQAQRDAAIKLEASAVSYTPVTTNVKALKKSYKMGAVDSLQQAINVMSAFVANIGNAGGNLRVTKWGALTVNQMGAALAKMKNDDPAFEVSGVTFEEEDKL